MTPELPIGVCSDGVLNSDMTLINAYCKMSNKNLFGMNWNVFKV